MQDFENSICPVCHGKLFADDDIAVCPDCGTPHHRNCYRLLGQCANSARHGSFTWQPPALKEEKAIPPSPPPGFHLTQNDRVGHVCPQCGRPSTSDVIFCPYCGHSFSADVRGSGGTPFPPVPQMPPFPGGFVHIVPPDPYGGVDPGLELDGVPVPEVARFVAANTRRYIPLFSRMFGQAQKETPQEGEPAKADVDGQKPAKHRKTGRNWAALLIPGYWFFFRKCYKEGILFTIASLISMALFSPFLAAVNESLVKIVQTNAPDMSAQMWDALTDTLFKSAPFTVAGLIAGAVLWLGTRIVAALLADYIYGKRVFSRLRVIREEAEDGAERENRIRAEGGVSLFIPLLAMMAVNFALGLLGLI
ncbi:MAG: hypothetical protein LBQ48_05530 [Oscillospiraceae bacterium]|jgi:hypothetical protein|nr:hypothetical protein [Oscillospiraceae bacterium]